MMNRTTRHQHTTKLGRDNWIIIVGNINSFPHDKDNHNILKLDKLRKMLMEQDSDIVLVSEHNKNLNRITKHMQPSTIIKGWWSNTITRSSSLASDSKTTFEPGGTMIITHSRSSAHTCHAEQDTQLLGRWNYITLRGKSGKYTTIISVYRPNRTQETYF